MTLERVASIALQAPDQSSLHATGNFLFRLDFKTNGALFITRSDTKLMSICVLR